MIIDTTQSTLFDFRVTGQVNLKLWRDGKLIDERNNHNLVMSVGRNYIANRIAKNTGDSGGVVIVSHMGIGTGSAGPTDDTKTALVTPTGARQPLTSTTVTNNQVTYVGEFLPAVGSGDIVEAGIFNDVSAGTMVARTTFGVITKVLNSDKLTLTWTLTVS